MQGRTQPWLASWLAGLVVHILSPSWLAGWLLHILARVGNSDDAVTIFSFGEIFLYGDGSEGYQEKNMLTGKP
jgi:hypothetical protein